MIGYTRLPTTVNTLRIMGTATVGIAPKTTFIASVVGRCAALVVALVPKWVYSIVGSRIRAALATTAMRLAPQTVFKPDMLTCKDSTYCSCPPLLIRPGYILTLDHNVGVFHAHSSRHSLAIGWLKHGTANED